MKMARREKTLALVAVGVATAFVLYRLVLGPVVRQQRDGWERVEQLRAELADRRASMQQRDLIEARYSQLAVELRQEGSDEAALSRLQQLLATKYSSRGGLVHRGTKVLSSGTPENGYRKFRISLELEGSPAALAGFLEDVCHGKAPIRVEQLDIRAAAGGGPRLEAVRASLILAAMYASGSPGAASQ